MIAAVSPTQSPYVVDKDGESVGRPLPLDSDFGTRLCESSEVSCSPTSCAELEPSDTGHEDRSMTDHTLPSASSARLGRRSIRDSIVVRLDESPNAEKEPAKLSQLPRRSNLKSDAVCPSSSSDTSSTAASSVATMCSKEVQFHTVQVREYKVTLGDHPDCSCGPPLSLSWTYEAFDPITVEQYETINQPRRTLRQLMTNYYHRKHILTTFAGFSERELKAASTEVRKIRRQRNRTRTFLPVRKLEEIAASATRKVKRTMCGHTQKSL